MSFLPSKYVPADSGDSGSICNLVPPNKMQDGDVSNPGELDEDDNHYSRSAKRARQACLGCRFVVLFSFRGSLFLTHARRRKKVRCSGERPVCAYCARLNQNCSYADAAKPPPYACLSAQLGLLPDPVSLSATVRAVKWRMPKDLL